MAGRAWCGVDAGERSYVVAVVDDRGRPLDVATFAEGRPEFDRLLGVLARYGRRRGSRIPVALENPRGALPLALMRRGHDVYALNPVSVAQYRARYTPSRAKSDAADAILLANILRTDHPLHHPMARDSDLCLAIRAISHAQAAASRDQVEIRLQLRGNLRSYYPAALGAFVSLAHRDALAVLPLLPTPADARNASQRQVAAALRLGGYQRGVEGKAQRIIAALRARGIDLDPQTEAAYGVVVTSLVHRLADTLQERGRLEGELARLFASHPDYAVFASFPGLGGVLGARILGELGDGRLRAVSPGVVRALAGTAPVTRQSGTASVVVRRQSYNRALHHAVCLWAQGLPRWTEPARRFYDVHRDKGERHPAVVRRLANKYLGVLYRCVLSGEPYDEARVAVLAP